MLSSNIFKGSILGVYFYVIWGVHPTILAFFLIGYGLVRFFIEYFRQPDAHLGFVWVSFSLGQILSGSMILGGAFLSVYVHRRKT